MEIVTLIIVSVTILLMMLSVVFFPSVVIFIKPHKQISINLYWVISLIGAILLIVTGCISLSDVSSSMFQSGSINPIKILILFYSMSILSIILDEYGFFGYIAGVVANKCKKSQKTLFICFYLCVSILTVFTSNDIIILTFTPFICSLCRKLKVSPIPYLIGEFIAANTLSMMLIIGNPTNIYLGSFYGVSFFEYLKVMAIPTLVTCVLVLLLLLLIFKKQLKKSIEIEKYENYKLNDKLSVIVSCAHLIIAIILLAIASYINMEMHIISLCLCLSLLCYSIIMCIIKKDGRVITKTLKRIPYDLSVYVLSMFVLVVSLKSSGILLELSKILNSFNNDILSYGVSSFLFSNLMNNIPMSVMFSEMIAGGGSYEALYASVVGSNLGAYLTPLGALAGIMWLGLLKNEKIDLTFKKFVLICAPVSIFAIMVCLITLGFVL